MVPVSSRASSSVLSLTLRPLTNLGRRSATLQVRQLVTGGRVPKEYIPSVDAGVQDAMQYGLLAGFPLVNIEATLLDGAYHEVDSSEMAFKVAGSRR